MQLAHKIKLNPNNKQITYFKKACGISRLTWNWALAEWNKEYINGEKPSRFSLNKKFNSIKKEQFPFMYEVTKCASAYPFIQLQNAYNRFFKHTSNKPHFKSKKKSKDSFYISNDLIKIKDKKVRIPKLGWVNMRENIRFDGRLLSATISREVNKWFISFSFELNAIPYQLCENQANVGVDLGIEKLATLSDGKYFENLKLIKKYSKKMRRMQRQLSRKQHSTKKGDITKQSNNYKKQAIKVAKLHQRIRNTRNDYLNKITTYITSNYKNIVIENLNVKGMIKNHHLAKSINDVSWGEFKRQLEYKSILRNNNLIIADRWFPSSKTCSNCGYINKKLRLSNRTFICPKCGNRIDRDLNASINLVKLVPQDLGEFTPVEICNVDLNNMKVLYKKHPINEAGIQQLTPINFGKV